MVTLEIRVKEIKGIPFNDIVKTKEDLEKIKGKYIIWESDIKKGERYLVDSDPVDENHWVYKDPRLLGDKDDPDFVKRNNIMIIDKII